MSKISGSIHLIQYTAMPIDAQNAQPPQNTNSEWPILPERGGSVEKNALRAAKF